MRLHLLSTGYLDDFHVRSVHTSRADAEAAAERRGFRDGDWQVTAVEFEGPAFEGPALGHLKRLLEKDPAIQGYTGDVSCYFCGAFAANVLLDEHEPGCPWVEAKAFVEALSSSTPSSPATGGPSALGDRR